MSGVDKTDVVSSTSRINFNSNVKSTDKIPKTTDSQSIIINFYSSSQDRPKTDKFIQTERPLTHFNKTAPTVQEITFKRKEASTSPLYETDSDDSGEDCRAPSEKKPAPLVYRLVSNDKKLERSMEARKQPNENKSPKTAINARTASDLERKKLEAELKAAEEIARLKESLIEKRLALELASIQDGNERHQKMALTHPSPPHPELRTLEELAMKKQVLIEANLSQELQSLELQNRLQPPRPSPPTPSGPSRQPSLSGKMNNFRTDSSSSVLNTFRNGPLIDRKFNFDKNFGGNLDVRNPSPSNFFSQMDPRYRPDERRLGYPRQESTFERKHFETGWFGQAPMSTPLEEAAYGPPKTHNNIAHSAWKSVMSKIKKKMKFSKSPPEWDNYPNEKQRGR